MRSSVALALSDDGIADGAVLIICCLGTLRSLMGVWGRTLLRYRDETPVNG